MSKTFAHLHNHSEYSLLDGAQTTEAMAQKGAELGLSALSLTDHGRMGGLVEFYSNCKKYGVKPILGMEAYITGIGRSRKDRIDQHRKTKEFIGTPRYERSNYHLILLAKNEQGYDNLCQLSTESYSTGFYQKPRIDYELLEKYKDGLIVSSACFAADTMVTTANGLKRIDEVEKGDLVLSKDGYFEEVLTPTVIGYNGDGYAIKLAHTFFPTVCTYDHKFLIYDDAMQSTVWKEAYQIKKNDKCIVPTYGTFYTGNNIIHADDVNKLIDEIFVINDNVRSKAHIKYMQHDIVLTNNIMRLFGLWLADGSMSLCKRKDTYAGSVTFSFGHRDFDTYYDSFVKAALDELGFKYSINNKKKNTVDIVMSSALTYCFFHYLFKNKKATAKSVPSCLMHISKDFDCELLYGYLLGDGCFDSSSKNPHGRIMSASVSITLANDMIELWRSLGIPSAVHIRSGLTGGILDFQHNDDGTKNDINVSSVRNINNRNTIVRTQYVVEITNKTFVCLSKHNVINHDLLMKSFEDAYKYVRSSKRSYINIDGTEYQINRVQSNNKMPIRGNVYCLSTADHTFVCNNAIVHNCIIGEVSNRLLNNDYKGAREVAMWFKKTFGDDYYLEVLNHNLAIEQAVMQPIRQLADELGIKVIATNDDHYTNKEDHKLQKTLMLLGMHKSWADSDVYGSYFGSDESEAGQRSVSDENGDSDPIFETPPELYMKNYDEMLEALLPNGGEGGVAEQELENTNEIAEKCNFDLPIIDPKDTSQYFLANYEIEQDNKYKEYHDEAYETPLYIVDACIDEMHKLGHEDVNSLQDFMTDDEIKSLSFLMFLCERGIDRLIKPKVEALGEPLPMSYWIDNPPENFEVKHAHNSPDELWIKAQQSEGKTPDDIIDIYRKRLAYETSIICAKKFVNYFLIVQSYVNFTREKGASIGPGRGSGCSSLICYLSGITAVDPIPNDLMFERFLNPDRSGYPDLDLDWGGNFRDNVLWPHIREMYGKNNTSAVAAYTYYWGKAAVKAAARVLFDCSNDKNLPEPVRKNGKDTSVRLGNAIADLIDNKPKLDLNGELDGSNEALTDLIRTDERYQQIINLALTLQGRISGEGQHASAYIVSPHQITNKMPLMVTKDERDKSQKSGTPVDNYLIQYDGRTTQDKLGYVKLDLLCINDLEVITTALNIVKRIYGCTIDIENIPLDDASAFELVQEGHNTGLFQFDGSPVAGRLLIDCQADCIGDWSVVNALNRPGPLQQSYPDQYIRGKLHPETITYFTPAAEKYLKDTYAVVAYQEELMLLSQDKQIVGFTGGEADTMRKILAHKDKAKIQGIVDLAHERAAENGVPKEVVDKFCDIAVAAGSYSFNKSHSLAYAIIAYRGAFLKAHFPEAFLAAMCQLKPDQKGKNKIPDYLEDARQLGVEVLPPHVNYSLVAFDVPRKGAIAYGLERIKGVGKSAQPIVDEREKNGPYTDFTDFCCRVPREVGKSALLPLIRYGALDGLGWSRKAMIESIDDVIAFRKKWFDEQEHRQSVEANIFDMFSLPTDPPATSASNTSSQSSASLASSAASDTSTASPASSTSPAATRPYERTVELVAPFDDEYTERELLRQQKETLGMCLSGSFEDYSQLNRFRIEREMRETYAKKVRTGRYNSKYDPMPIMVSDVPRLPNQRLVEMMCVVSDPEGKNRDNPRMFRSGKGCSIFVYDHGANEESRFGFSPRRYSTKLTVFSRTWDSLPVFPRPGDVLHIIGRISIDADSNFPPAVIVDQLDVIDEDSALFGKMSREELMQLQKDFNEYKRHVSDPNDDRYLIPVLEFETKEDMDEFLDAPGTQKYMGNGRVQVISDDETSTLKKIVNLKQTRGMVKWAAGFGAKAYKTRLPKAQSAIDRAKLMKSDDASGSGESGDGGGADTDA